MTTWRPAALAVLAFAALVVTAPHAGACSCMYEDAETRYREADAAVIGTVVAGDEERVTLRVEHEFKVDLPDEIVLENGQASACGLGLEPGDDDVGLFLHRDGAGWAASLCDAVDPDDLPGAAERLPPPAGRGTAVLLAYGGFSGGRLAALDAEGRPLAYGAGAGETRHLSVCPRSELAVELASEERNAAAVVVRRLRDMQVLTERRPPIAGRPIQVSCRDPQARSIVVAFDRRRGRDDLVVAFRDGRPRTLHRGPMMHVELVDDFAFVDEGPRGDVHAVNTVTGTRWRLRGVRPYTSDWAVSPDGSRAAAITSGWDRRRGDGDGEAALVVAQLRGARRVRQRDAGMYLFDGSVLWLDDDRLLMGGDSNALRLFDERGRALRRYRSRPEPVKLTLAGGRLYGLGTVEGGLLAADPPHYTERGLGDLPAEGLSTLVAIPGGTEIDMLG